MQFGYEVFHPDVQAVADFYVDVLGFARDGERDDDYQAVTRDGLQVGCSRDAEAPLQPRKPPVGSEVVLRVDDLQAEVTRVAASGWPVEDPVQHRPWGMTDFRLFDPTGQYVRITGPRQPDPPEGSSS